MKEKIELGPYNIKGNSQLEKEKQIFVILKNYLCKSIGPFCQKINWMRQLYKLGFVNLDETLKLVLRKK